MRAAKERLDTRLVCGVLLAAGLVAGGFVLADDYGISTDEPYNYAVGVDAIRSYMSPADYDYYLRWGETLAHHGSSYFVPYAAFSKLFSFMFPVWTLADARHLANFITFLVGALAFHLIFARFVGRRDAWIGTLLLVTQPLLFGHAFINQKDTPFAVFFLLSIALGLSVGERLGATTPQPVATGHLSHSNERSPSCASCRRIWILLLVLWSSVTALIIVDLWILDARSGSALLLMSRVVAGIAEVPLRVRPSDVAWSYGLLRIPITVLALMVLSMIGRASMQMPPVPAWRPIKRQAWMVVLTGAVIGLTIGIRPIGGLAFVLVALLWLTKHHSRAFIPVLVVTAVALFTMHITWPYLWDAPLLRLVQSVQYTVDFQEKSVLYLGDSFSSTDLPWHYFPYLASISLTEPTVLCLVVGLVVVITRAVRRLLEWQLALVLAIWFFVPVLSLIVLDMGVYDGIRQLLFALAPVLIVAGVGLSHVAGKATKAWAKAAIVVLAVAPGVLGIISLHPYEYTYYNRFVGGVSGARADFHNDYWCTSMREAMQAVNELAAPGDLVIIRGSIPAAQAYARSDIEITRDEWLLGEAEFVLTCDDWVPASTAGLEQVFSVQRQGVPYAVLYRRVSQTPIAP